MIPITVPSRKFLCGAPLAAAALIALCAAGCVQRRMTVRSNPPGAFLYVDNYPIGTTPVSTDFTYYGKRQFRLVRDGYETLTVEQRVWPPWYEWFGIDFVSENLIPYTFRDERQLSFQMIPQQIPPSPQLAARAEELRIEPGAALRPASGAAPIATSASGCTAAATATATGRPAAADGPAGLRLAAAGRSARRASGHARAASRHGTTELPGVAAWRALRSGRHTSVTTDLATASARSPTARSARGALATRFERRTGASHYFSAAILDRSEASSRQSRTSNASLAQRLAATAYRAAW